MPILGLVVTLSGEPGPAYDRAVAALSAMHGLELGDAPGPRLPAVLEAVSPGDADEAVRALGAADGVVHVDVVYADFSDIVSDVGQPAAEMAEEW